MSASNVALGMISYVIACNASPTDLAVPGERLRLLRSSVSMSFGTSIVRRDMRSDA